MFDDVWTTIGARYYDPNFRGVDWEAQRIAFRQLAANARSTQQLYGVLRQMLGRLNDPHTRVFSPEEKFDWEHPRFVTIGLSIKEIDGVATVVHVEHGSEPDKAGIRAGDVIESVDGQPAASIVGRKLAAGPASPIARTRAFATIFDGPAGSMLDLVWRNRGEGKNHARFQRYLFERDLDYRIESQDGRYIAVELDGFTSDLANSFVRNLRNKIAASRGVILDLRNNGGGDAQAMAQIAAIFLGPGTDMGQFTDRSGGGFNILTTLRSATDGPGLKVPIVVLTSERTSSAAEILVSALKQSKSAVVIGTQTCGCVLAIRNRHELPDGGILDVSEMDYQTATGARLEGNGIAPDKLMLVHRPDLYAKRDPLVESAFAYLKSLRARRN